MTSSDKPLQFAPFQTIIRRGWIALGVIIIAFTLLYDLISAVDYYSFEYVIGKNQFIIILIGIMIFLTGVIFPGRILANSREE